MASTPLDATRGGREEAKGADSASPAANAAAPGGFKAWLPLLIAVVAMPALAFATTKFILLPKLAGAMGAGKGVVATAPAAESTSSTAKEGGKPAVPGKVKISVPMSKMLVNVSGTMGTRYLLTSVTLVSNNPDFKSAVEDNKDQLMDLATSTLSSKTISDLEKPGARNVIRAELMAVFNNALGSSMVQEIYITEMAIQ